ncbi:MAG: hypothetical protein BGN97_00345 [Microbacterium sp. 69-10]|uniref:hypothetical protein n=1 Tax=Microbacterium sp. 69-10 TaxID=1895783 RepID=UPI0009630C15|nr:hypothetical protein [Microbacterium sp. 69-10]OJU39704.1 MAG: hypothetical protein BGN97_00345 [Microbacterium sp. 69-10]
MSDRRVELDHYTSARYGTHTVVAVLHVEDPVIGDQAFGCGHRHRHEGTAAACAREKWPDVEVREVLSWRT